MVNFPTSFGVGCFQRTWCTIWYSILFPSEFYLIFHIWYFRVIFHSFSPYTDGRKWNDHKRCCIFWHQLISWFRSSGTKIWVSFIRNCSLFFNLGFHVPGSYHISLFSNYYKVYPFIEYMDINIQKQPSRCS